VEAAPPAAAASTENVSVPAAALPAAEAVPAPATVTPISASPKWIAKEIPLQDNEGVISLEQEMHKATAVLRAATSGADFSAVAVMEPPAAVGKIESDTTAPEASAPVESRAEEDPATPAAEPQPETVAAVAAAASASSACSEVSVPETPSQPAAVASSEAPASVPATDTKPAEAELAAAWAQWKQIRESVVGPQLTAQIVDVAAAGLKETQAEQASGETQSPEKSSTAPSNPTAIANIVDSVLAELKPKLLEEIAKKLGKDKK
jgi:hypothetical protein